MDRLCWGHFFHGYSLWAAVSKMIVVVVSLPVLRVPHFISGLVLVFAVLQWTVHLSVCCNCILIWGHLLNIWIFWSCWNVLNSKLSPKQDEVQLIATNELHHHHQEQQQTPPPKRSQRQRRPVQQYHQQQLEQQQQAAQQRLQRQQQRQQLQKQLQQQRAQQRQMHQQQQKQQQQQQQQQSQQRGVKRKEPEVQVVRQTKAQKTSRGEVGGAGTLKYRKRVSTRLDSDFLELVFLVGML